MFLFISTTLFSYGIIFITTFLFKHIYYLYIKLYFVFNNFKKKYKNFGLCSVIFVISEKDSRIIELIKKVSLEETASQSSFWENNGQLIVITTAIILFSLVFMKGFGLLWFKPTIVDLSVPFTNEFLNNLITLEIPDQLITAFDYLIDEDYFEDFIYIMGNLLNNKFDTDIYTNPALALHKVNELILSTPNEMLEVFKIIIEQL